jgi:hypothetical protein
MGKETMMSESDGANEPKAAEPKRKSKHAGEKAIQVWMPVNIHRTLLAQARYNNMSLQDYTLNALIHYLKTTYLKKVVVAEGLQPHLEGLPNE